MASFFSSSSPSRFQSNFIYLMRILVFIRLSVTGCERLAAALAPLLAVLLHGQPPLFCSSGSVTLFGKDRRTYISPRNTWLTNDLRPPNTMNQRQLVAPSRFLCRRGCALPRSLLSLLRRTLETA